MDLLYLIEILPYNIVPPEKSFMFRKISHKINELILNNNIKLPIYIKPNINLLVLCDSQKNNHILEDLEKLIINYNIIKLELPDCKIGKNNVERLTRIIKTCPNLTYLNLCNNKFHYDEFIIIGKELKELKSLKYIDFSHNHIEIYMDMIIFKKIPELFLLQNNYNLKELNLNNNRLGPRGAVILSKILPQLPKLKILDISHNSIRSNGATSLAESLGKLTSLTKLDLTQNFIESSGAQKIADVLPCCSSLTCLKLKNNWLGNVNDILQKVLSLEDLDISNNNLGNQIDIIIEVLPSCLSLIYLNIETNNIRQHNIEKLYNAKKLLFDNKILEAKKILLTNNFEVNNLSFVNKIIKIRKLMQIGKISEGQEQCKKLKPIFII